MKLKALILTIALASIGNVANATVLGGGKSFLGCEEIEDLSKDIMRFRLHGAPKNWMIQQIKKSIYNPNEEIYAHIGVKLIESAFKIEDPKDESQRRELVRSFGQEYKDLCLKATQPKPQAPELSVTDE